MSMSPQVSQVLNLMQRDGYVTRLTAGHYGINNLTARFADLRLRHGYGIRCEKKTDALGRPYSRWSLDSRKAVNMNDGVPA